MLDTRFHVVLDGAVAFRARGEGREPDPVTVATLAELAGADGVSLRLRSDLRGVQDRDLRLLRETLRTRLDLALAPAADLVSTAFDARPHRVTLVPEARDAPDAGGLDVRLLKDALRAHVDHLHDADIEVAGRIEPDLEQVKALHRVNVDVAVLYAGHFARASTRKERRLELTRLGDAVTTAARLNLKVAVGGGLDLAACEELARLPHVEEFHVGHACLARAMLLGMERSVRDFLAAISRGRVRGG
jgi:pyridoxine 5-phosphate synthase